MSDVRITIEMPCYGRPERTKRSIQCILDQDINNWEAFIMGDACPHFQRLIDSGYLQSIKEEQEKKGNIIHFFNEESNGGGCGYKLINYALKNAIGKYFVFFANDDIILPNHFSNYLSEIENTDYDMVYYNSHLAPFNSDRQTILAPSCIGHCDIIVKTETAREINSHTEKYTHDWDFIYELILNKKYKKANSELATYRVMRLGNGPVVDSID
jgi:glycosyltransferase involved in cell wall biosynthesis